MDADETPSREAVIRSHTVHLGAVLQILWRRKWLILSVTVLGGLVGYWLASILPAQYTAETTLLIERPENNPSTAKAVYRFDTQTKEYFLTQFEVLRSDDLAFSVYESLVHDQNDVSGSRTIRNEVISRFPILKTVMQYWHDLGDGQTGSEGAPKARRKFESFKKSLAILPLTNTQAVKVQFTAQDPALAAKVTNTLAQQYIQNGSEALIKDAASALSGLRQHLDAVNTQLQVSEHALQTYRDRHKLVHLDDIQTLQESELRQASEKVKSAKAHVTEAKSNYDQVAGLEKDSSARAYYANPLLAGSAGLRTVQENYKDAQVEFASLSQTLTAKHPSLMAARARLQVAKRALAEQSEARVRAIRSEYANAVDALEQARSALSTSKTAMQGLNQKQLRLNELANDVEVNRKLQSQLLSKVSSLDNIAGLVPNLAKIIDKAEPPIKPNGPGVAPLSLATAVFMGISVMILLLWRDAVDNSLKSPDDVKLSLGYDLLGHIPRARASSESVGLFLISRPGSFTAEAVRSLCATVQIRKKKYGCRTLCVTSSLPREGKTTVSLSLALALAQSHKTLLIDGAISQPRLSLLLGTPQERPGLFDVLRKSAAVCEAVRTLSGSNLDILPITGLPPCPQHVLARNEFDRVIASLGEIYDEIIIDCGPVLAASETLLWAQNCDGVVLVTKAGSTRPELARCALIKLEAISVPILGVIMNCSRPEFSVQFDDFFSDYVNVKYPSVKQLRKLSSSGADMTGSANELAQASRRMMAADSNQQ